MKRPPSIALVKGVNQPHATPGTDLTYRINFTNGGGTPAQDLVITDPVPASTDFKLNSVINNLGTTRLKVRVSYSNNGGVTYTYMPTDGAGGAPAGYDRTITHIRWTFTGKVSPRAPDNAGSVSFTTRIRKEK